MIRTAGVAASPGIAVGPIYLHVPPALAVDDKVVPMAARAAELDAFTSGMARAAAGLEALIEHVRAERGDDLARVFEGHLDILLDKEIRADVAERIRVRGQTALAAARDSLQARRAEFLALDDDYLRQRADDLVDIQRRLMCAIAGVEDAQLKDTPAGAVIVAHDLTPSETARLDPARVGGFVVAAGGPTSHVAILARMLELPAVIRCANALEAARGARLVALDGGSGAVVFDPDAETFAAFERRGAAYRAELEAMRELANLPAETRDGHRVLLAANIGAPADVEAALRWRPDGVGLFRTEFLFMGSSGLPSEDEQYRAYSAVARAMKGHPVVIRTIDVGGDKPIAGLGFDEEDNPFLGWRGARLFLYGEDASSPNRDPDMMRHMAAQVGAILRAGADGEVWLMWPMIASVEEIETLHGLIDEVRAGLSARGVGFGKVRVGAMIETPGAAMVADKLAQKLDFFSIGSNDLTQYALAADRGNERVAPIYQPFHPGVWRLIANVIDAGHAHAIPVAVCGELAGMEEAALPLIGLGLDEFSMAAPMLPRIKRIIRGATLDEARAVARAVLDAPTAAAALACARAAMQEAIARRG